MKNVVILLVCFLFSSFVFSQNVNSSCNANDSIRNLYRTDAARLVVRDYIETSSTYLDSILIQEEKIEDILDVLIAIYNVEGLSARDTVIDFLDIHTWYSPSVNSFSLAIDTTAPYLQNLHDGIFPCGNTTIDSLMDLYELNICYYSTFSGITSFHSLTVCSDLFINVEPIISAFDTITGVSWAETSGSYGSGNDINIQQFSNYYEVTFSHGWGDCPSYCMYHRYWNFRVYDDCSVTYLGSYGNVLPYSWTSISNIESNFSIIPNPFSSFIDIDGINCGFKFSIYNLFGQEVYSGTSICSKIDNIDFLQPGSYIIIIETEYKVYVEKIIKI